MICAFTGPRLLPFPLTPGNPGFDDLCLRLQKEITLLCEQGVTDFYCGMALGADQLCAEILLELKQSFPGVRLHAAVPFPGQAIRWGKEQQARYYELQHRCDTVTCLSESYRDDCCLVRNRWMVDRADELLAVCDPGRISRRSGTGATVRYARSQGRRIVFVSPELQQIPGLAVQHVADGLQR